MKIFQKLGSESSIVRDIADSSPKDLLSFKTLILGVSTWGIGEVQDDWLDFLSHYEELVLTGKKVAIFGLGDQESYPDTFADALGKLYEALEPKGCEIVGEWSTLGYEFLESAAVRNGMFAGLVLDEENQPELTDLRITDWLKEFIQEPVMDLKA